VLLQGLDGFVVATVTWYFEVISDHNIVEAFSLRFVIQFDLDI